MYIEVRNVIKLFEEGLSAGEVAKLTEFTKPGLTRKLKKIGFKYVDGKWIFNGDEGDMNVRVAPLTVEGMEVVSRSQLNTIDEGNTDENNKEYEYSLESKKDEGNNNEGNKEYSYSRTSKREDIVDSMNSYKIGLTKGNRKRNSWNVDVDLQHTLDLFTKEMRLNQSDVMDLALRELFSKYNIKILRK